MALSSNIFSKWKKCKKGKKSFILNNDFVKFNFFDAATELPIRYIFISVSKQKNKTVFSQNLEIVF